MAARTVGVGSAQQPYPPADDEGGDDMGDGQRPTSTNQPTSGGNDETKLGGDDSGIKPTALQVGPAHGDGQHDGVTQQK